MAGSNIQNNSDFIKLFNGIKERYMKGVNFTDDPTLEGDTYDCINNMITAIELGSGDDAFIGLFLPKMNRMYDFKLNAPAAIAMVNSVPTLFLNPQLMFIMIEDYYDFKCLIQHEVYHLVFKHLIQSRNYPNHDRTNIAMDTSINQHITFSNNLAKACYTLENFCKKFNVKAECKREFEYYYDLIPDDYNEIDQTLKKMLQDLNDLKDKKSQASGQAEKDELEQQIQDKIEEIKDYIKENYTLGDISGNEGTAESLGDQLTLDELVSQTLQEAKSRGKMPGSLEKILNDMYFKDPIIPWQKEFRHLVGSIPCPYKKTMRVKNRRQPNRADILGRVNDRKVRVLLAIDTSGSVSDNELKFFFNEIFNILKDVNAEVFLAQCDSSLKSYEQIVKKNDVSKIKVVGRGGTCFTPVFEYVHKDIPKPSRPDIIVYFTDGYGEDQIPTEYKDNYEVLWVLTGLGNTLSVKTPAYIKKVRFLNIEGKKYI